ncbi:MAG: trehalose-phosphatase, partial [Acidobacteriota bacterium]
MSEAKEGRNLPSALAERDQIALRLRGRRPAVFLDYDGTLTPIVSRPELATLPAAMREVLKEVAARVPVAIVSGRDRRDVEALVGLEGLIYAGSHGFDITGPNGLRMEYLAAKP